MRLSPYSHGGNEREFIGDPFIGSSVRRLIGCFRRGRPYLGVNQPMDRFFIGGEGGIRTLETLSGLPVFETGLINHSSTSPGLQEGES
jgi:hypothetical protein